jgi:hypothetical protein
MDKPPGPGDLQISEQWLMEWVEFGWSGPHGILDLLASHARFDAWCETHHREADECQP